MVTTLTRTERLLICQLPAQIKLAGTLATRMVRSDMADRDKWASFWKQVEFDLRKDEVRLRGAASGSASA